MSKKIMKILGLGMDIVHVTRITKIILRFKDLFAKKILTTNEIYQYYKCSNQKTYFLAKHFAVKEATVKALHTGFSKGIFFKHIELNHDQYGCPTIKLYNHALHIIQTKKKYFETHVTITDEKEYVSAIVIIL
ncbi:holo-ACP synthase [Enterobacteriaceae endosymbiont of Macroplea appendiculata]|uniref:holo-ACP synthase n=1 Tax=Enterobacteriaceae endosymbiont of Macroplea appendiculata TaxID=2675790 RepID=UPI00144987AD|nr:holo-ACP synthase [Enterobacteriaceae endosymbiont of Macroplea appendiculata]QJC30788.1 holo-ACP synthase [Enterobacteriaceae endosymbiont of Macroplea appendiculata]